jgi:glycosyltransferase involved in cell wall biosynthesis
MNQQLALTFICYNETYELERMLRSIAPYVGGLFATWTGDNPKTEEILKKYNVIYVKDNSASYIIDEKMVEWLKIFFGWTPEAKVGDRIFQFDKARNTSLELIPKSFKYFLWIDADDVFRGGDKLTAVLKRIDQSGANAMFLNYLYDVEVNDKGEISNILIQHLRERIILHNGQYKWIAPIHETLIPQSGDARQLEDKTCDIVHLSSREKKQGAISRNIKALEKSIYDLQGNDPRPIYYLAKAYFDLHIPESHVRAEKLIYRYLKTSGWAEERSQAYEYLSEIFRGRKELNKAIKAAHNALIESPKFPSTYLSLGLTYLLQGRNEEALFWTQLAAKVPIPQTTLVIQPRDMVARALEITFNVSMKTNQLDEAWASIMKLKDMFPNDENIQNQWKFIDGIKYQRELSKVYVGLAKVIEQSGDKHKLAALAEAAPKEIQDNPIISDFIKRVKPPRVWGDKEIAIYCGPGWTVWSPKFYDKKTNEIFIGGSEEAVILASRELSKRGYKVTVYGDPGEEGNYDGVTYLNHFKFNVNDNFNILMVWRNISLFNFKFKARKTYLWLHDVPVALDYKKERLDNITKIMVLSKAQRELLPLVAEDKFFYTSNGYKEENPKIKSKNISSRCIWTSSYDRGLQHLLEVWENVKKEVPNAELRVFYGWQLFDKFYSNNPERMAWKKKMEDKMKELGVYHGGRLTQADIEKEYKQAGLWTYPTDFYEINCISAIKSQAYGAVPVTMNYAALKETVQHGVKVDGDIWDSETKQTYKNALIKAMKESFNREDMMKWAKEKYSWKTITSLWIKEFYG